MRFEQTLIPGTMIRRYKRFLADIELEDGSVVTAHCANSGSMKTCWEPGWPVRISKSNNPKRKLAYTLELIHNGRCWIGINTQHPNKMAEEAVRDGRIKGLGPFAELKREVKYGTNSRVDLLGIEEDGRRCYIEVKNVTLVMEDGTYQFPDSVTIRGQKHLDELAACVTQGHRAAMLFVVQRSDGSHFEPARSIDPAYADKLRSAADVGVELYVCPATVTPEQLELSGAIIEYRI